MNQNTLILNESVTALSLAINDPNEHGTLPIFRHFEEYAQKFPQAIAGTFAQEDLSYGKLNSQANQLANYLISQQVKPQDCVGVLLEPGLEILVAILAIHKINGIYVPIDSEYPLGRIKNMVTQVAPTAIICAGDRTTEINDHFDDLKIINLTTLDLSSWADSNLNYACPPESISHIFFTSGTTGTPKGVVSTHSNLIHYIFTAQAKYRFDREDSFLCSARFTFSISLFMLLLPLVCGGRVNLITREQLLDPKLLTQAIKQSSFLHLNPSLLKILLDDLDQNVQEIKQFKLIKHVSSGGDMIPAKILNRLNQRFTEAEVYAIYGSSELSCMGCSYFVPKELNLEQTLVGKPFDNVQLRVLDDQQQAVLPGVKGEIYFSGTGVTQGYLNLPSLTAAKYILLDGDRFYRTGDIGCLTPQGELQILGREDNQVQIRGMRVELGEIEAQLNFHPAISNSIVVAKEDQLGEKQLIAYVIAALEVPTPQALRNFLQEILPQYMIPACFIFVQEFPLNLNGKVDRRTLSARPLQLDSQTAIAPQTVTEQQIAIIWQEILGLNSIGINDNFFDLGGYSLLAIALHSQLEEAFETTFPLGMVFQLSTISQQASFFGQQETEKLYSTLAPIQPLGTKPPLFLFNGIGIYYPLSACLGKDQPVYSLAIEMVDNSEHLLEQVDGLAARYIQEIKTIQPHGPYYLGGLSFGGMVAYETAQQLQAQGEEIAVLALFDTWELKAYTSYSLPRRLFTHVSNFARSPFQYLFSKLTTSKKFFQIKQKLLNKSDLDQIVENYPEPEEDKLPEIAVRYLEAQKHYVPQIYSGRVTLFKAQAEYEEMITFGEFAEQFGWKNLVTGGLEIIMIPGDHCGILKQPYVEKLAGELQRCMADAQANVH